MPAFKPQQRHIVIQDREFHFVSYDKIPADEKRDREAVPAMWYLMVEGRRCEVFPCDDSMDVEEVDAALTVWAEQNAIDEDDQSAGAVSQRAASAASSAASGTDRRQQNWWGPN
jgi:hypothetical protein